jgi:DNA-binding response OmpR family regulator
MHRLLLVDDDPRLGADLSAGLSARGYAVDVAADAESARTRLGEGAPYDLVLLDVTLPHESGWCVLEGLRSAGDRTPVIFLTAHHEPEQRVRGLRLGADDYVAKPFEFEELVARVEAVLRRHRPPVVFELGPVRVDLSARRATRNGRDLELSMRELALLEALILADGAVLSRGDLMQRVWNMPADTRSNVVEVMVMRLRKKLDRGGGHAIQTIVGEGYRVRAERLRS